MKKEGSSLAAALALGLVTSLAGTATSAGTLSDKKNLVCASVEVVACIDGGNCQQGKAQTFDIPTFMFIDFKGKIIHTAGDDDGDAASPIKAKEVSERSIILQGFENHRGWTLAIDRSDGEMTLSSTGPEVNFMIMGNCTTL